LIGINPFDGDLDDARDMQAEAAAMSGEEDAY